MRRPPEPIMKDAMEIIKESLNREIERLDGKIAQELEQMKHYAEWIMERIGNPEADGMKRRKKYKTSLSLIYFPNFARNEPFSPPAPQPLTVIMRQTPKLDHGLNLSVVFPHMQAVQSHGTRHRNSCTTSWY